MVPATSDLPNAVGQVSLGWAGCVDVSFSSYSGFWPPGGHMRNTCPTCTHVLAHGFWWRVEEEPRHVVTQPDPCSVKPGQSATLEMEGRAWPGVTGLSSLDLSVWKDPKRGRPKILFSVSLPATLPRPHFSLEMTGQTPVQTLV